MLLNGRRGFLSIIGSFGIYPTINSTTQTTYPISAISELSQAKANLIMKANTQWAKRTPKHIYRKIELEEDNRFGLTPFGDWDYYYTRGTALWQPNTTQEPNEVIVPKGFVTDLTSIPQELWSFGVRPEGRYAYAAVIHDYLYWTQTRCREEADLIFLIAMKDSLVQTFLREKIHKTVRLLGKNAWNKNAALKKLVEKRILREFPKDPMISWGDWKKRSNFFSD